MEVSTGKAKASATTRLHLFIQVHRHSHFIVQRFIYLISEMLKHFSSAVHLCNANRVSPRDSGGPCVFEAFGILFVCSASLFLACGIHAHVHVCAQDVVVCAGSCWLSPVFLFLPQCFHHVLVCVDGSFSDQTLCGRLLCSHRLLHCNVFLRYSRWKAGTTKGRDREKKRGNLFRLSVCLFVDLTLSICLSVFVFCSFEVCFSIACNLGVLMD